MLPARGCTPRGGGAHARSPYRRPGAGRALLYAIYVSGMCARASNKARERVQNSLEKSARAPGVGIERAGERERERESSVASVVNPPPDQPGAPCWRRAARSNSRVQLAVLLLHHIYTLAFYSLVRGVYNIAVVVFIFEYTSRGTVARCYKEGREEHSLCVHTSYYGAIERELLALVRGVFSPSLSLSLCVCERE